MMIGRTWMAAAVLMASAAPPPPDDLTLRARYAIPTSRFIEIEGTPIHYADEGSGPAIVLIHGSFGSLRQWNGWAAALRKHYRVVRLDLPPAGLSGPSPDADYTIEAKLHILEALRERLGIDRFLLVSTSSGSITGAAYAALYPQHVSGLIYSNATVGHLEMNTADYPAALKQAVAEDATHKGYHKDKLWKQIMLYHFAHPSKVTPALVREWTELNNRALAMPPSPKGKAGPTHERTPGDLAAIKAPVLFLWGNHDKEAPVEKDAREGMRLLPGTDKTLVVIPTCGHMLALDCSAQALAGAMSFIRRVNGGDRR
jgi:pimeloyl-ACP methyl ester carboxylesterase